ncbi:MAG TPA: helix-turn-helix domain-containing protein [bacterium]|nr:helix-turn-helix domain-containing protein [bacterium]HOM26053.1 helix-turn-helix domain-containing protein [bacterium]
MDLKSLSELIKKEREKKEIDYDRIYRDTKIVRKFIEYIEDGEWNKFPGNFYRKAVLKKYLDYLGIEGINLDELFEEKKETCEEEIIEPKRERKDERNKEKNEKKFYSDTKFYILIFLFLLFILLLLIGNLLFENLIK